MCTWTDPSVSTKSDAEQSPLCCRHQKEGTGPKFARPKVHHQGGSTWNSVGVKVRHPLTQEEYEERYATWPRWGSVPVIDDDDPRHHTTFRVLKRPDGARYLEVDGMELPVFTRGDIDVRPLGTLPYWPSGPPGAPYGYEVNLTLFVERVEVEDTDLLKGSDS